MYTIRYGTTTITYDILRKPSLKNTYISVDRSGVLVKTNERTTISEIECFVLKKSAWIHKHLQTYKARAEAGKIQTGSRLYYLGKSYYVECIKEEQDDIEVKFIHSKFIIKAPQKASQTALHQAIDAFYKEKAESKILPLVRKWSEEMDLSPAHVSFRRADKRWGSCSSANRISFNYQLMKLPRPLIEYVVVHELAHIRHKNHSAGFWALMKRHIPEYRKIKEQIRGFEKIL